MVIYWPSKLVLYIYYTLKDVGTYRKHMSSPLRIWSLQKCSNRGRDCNREIPSKTPFWLYVITARSLSYIGIARRNYFGTQEHSKQQRASKVVWICHRKDLQIVVDQPWHCRPHYGEVVHFSGSHVLSTESLSSLCLAKCYCGHCAKIAFGNR